eukprot:TRINITY_DN55281_c0_g1_i1.p2 TRINITY_DN55281_c0_g1~~TRINITY_DN55281_c0_g1_i1.p2  ORF type:complete len:111 (+),score=15.62 TRINITY_DN55281_c0_g1_i1:238-570(+)
MLFESERLMVSVEDDVPPEEVRLYESVGLVLSEGVRVAVIDKVAVMGRDNVLDREFVMDDVFVVVRIERLVVRRADWVRDSDNDSELLVAVVTVQIGPDQPLLQLQTQFG